MPGAMDDQIDAAAGQRLEKTPPVGIHIHECNGLDGVPS